MSVYVLCNNKPQVNHPRLVLLLLMINPGGAGVLPQKLGRGVRPASQNPYPIYDQNLRFSLPYLWPDQKFDTQFISLVQTNVKGNV